ncbi:isoquinoline 1-oxidoreductase beta subunit [Roseivirga pacifica]|uniref:Isoquinoline 1-oxidoreductase, beta subunit n=1 Tax=Roseivirga pacifica TaxID=1267423 RepID=A0A1I0QVZ0_9BACT|nr:molybdopterin cofactor-binding domain-containing protein [Roseivirga pacifica]RKQ42467.1 isoquinoline 1-oxidoreductase beta subunit [Roseivirga pacifica]SEW31872.1 isoquinoline 1-oxidoreductase, beta subunit [Roseivirga pacifica]
MTLIKTKVDRRSFLKTSALAGGGLMIGFAWGCSPAETVRPPASEWFDINAFLTIADNGEITIMSPNPEIGQNVKTSMPMIVAEELDASWEDVIVKQAPLDTKNYQRQVAGGSQSIRQGWQSLRMAGATARHLMVLTAAKEWGVDAASLKTENGYVVNGSEKRSYGELASKAAGIEVPAEVPLKDPKDFKIIGKSKKNVDLDEIVTGKPLFGIDYQKEGMVYAAVLRPQAFGTRLKTLDDTEARKVNGVIDVVRFTDHTSDADKARGEKVAVIATNTWAAIKGQRALKVTWEDSQHRESTPEHIAKLDAALKKADGKSERRNDGNINKAFAEADGVFEKSYEAPFLPHNTLEPMNFFADVTDEKVELMGPIQTPQWSLGTIAQLLGRDESEISIGMTRMGGGFGRRLYGDFVVEAAAISNKIRKPVKLQYTREDDMTAGIYRPSSKYRFKAAYKNGKVTGYHLTGAGIRMGGTTREHWFPAGGIENYRVDSHNIDSNITTGAWRAPVTNFLAVAEQSFFDELAEEMGIDAIQLRLDILEQAKSNPFGEPLDYEPEKMIGVIKLAADKGNWGKAPNGVSKGFSSYYSHNTYVAEVVDVVTENGQPRVSNITVAVDCGIVVNPDAAINQVQGGAVDGIGHAMYGDFGFENGTPQANNFDKFRLIRSKEAPSVDVHFVESLNSPTGLGEPSLPPAGGALANAIAAATGRRIYKIPFAKQDLAMG